MAPASADNVNPDHMNFVLNVMSHVEDLKVDWNAVAEDNGIGYARNASSKFKDTVKKYGYKYEANKMTKTDDNGDDTQAAAVPKTPSKRVKKTSDGKTSRSAKKQKVVQKVAQLPGDDDKEDVNAEAAVEAEDEQIIDGGEEGVQA